MKTYYFFALLIGISFTSLLNAQFQIGNTIVGEANGDLSGRTICMPDNKTIAIGAPNNGSNLGHVRVFEIIGSTWVQKGADLDGQPPEILQGTFLHMPDANTLAIGNGGFVGNPKSRVFKWDGLAWVQKGLDITSIASRDRTGPVFMFDSNTIAVGSYLGLVNGLRFGYVRIFTWNGLAWVQKGGIISGDSEGSNFGITISMPDSNTVAIGGPLHDGNGVESGHVRIHRWDGTSWIQKGVDLDGAADNFFGRSISMPDTNTLAVGAPGDGSIGNITAGYVRVFNWNGVSWVQKGIDISGVLSSDYFGFSISMSDSNNIAIGASNKNSGNGPYSGQVRVYRWNGSAWLQRGNDYNGRSDDFFGYSVSMPDSNTLAVGAPEFNTLADSGHVKVFSLCNSANVFSTIFCGNYLSPSGKYTWSTSGTYIDTIPNSQNCDSILTINLTITPLVLTISNFSTTLASNEFGATYQWVDCDSNYAPVIGANSQLFSPTKSGNYAVILSKNGCVDTSACENVTIVGMLENVFNTARVFPNPTDGAFTIDLGAQNQEVDLWVNSIDGQLVYQKNKVNSNQLSIDLSNQPKGVFFVTLQNKDAIRVIKLVRD